MAEVQGECSNGNLKHGRSTGNSWISRNCHCAHLTAAVSLQALGLKPKVVKDKIQPHLDGREMKQLMEGGQEEAEGAAERDPADMIKGVGYRR